MKKSSKLCNRQTARQKDRQPDRKTNTNRQTKRTTDGEIKAHRQAERKTNTDRQTGKCDTDRRRDTKGTYEVFKENQKDKKQ